MNLAFGILVESKAMSELQSLGKGMEKNYTKKQWMFDEESR